MGTGGIAAGGVDVISSFEERFNALGIDASVEKNCSVHKVGCRGFCARDVLVDVIIDGKKSTYEYIKPDMVQRIVDEHIVRGQVVEEWMVKEDYHTFHEKQVKVVLSDCGEVDPEDITSYMSRGGYDALKDVLSSKTPEEVISVIDESGLRGRGGAGFPTGFKWNSARKVETEKKYIICNADEGDPGAFMDRSVIEGNPHSVIEGMTVGAYAIGSGKGYVYIRAEYIKIKLGAGAFVCGEETALMASIEGNRGMPRAKPPFPAQKGLWGFPTVINNVETLANVPYILRNGAQWFAKYGTEKSKGTKVFALTGKVKNSGLIEVPMGIKLSEIVFDIGGGIEGDKLLKAVQTGGPSGGCIPLDMMDLPVDYESLAKVGSIVGSGGMVVMDETNCMVNIAKYFLEFTQAESCGKCIPCRIGTKRLLEILERITDGKGRPDDIELLEQMSSDIKLSSLCGLGQTAPNPVLSTLRYFRKEYEAHVFEKKCPAGVCKILDEFCKGCTMCARVCPAGAIVGEKKQPHKIIQEICIKCGACFETCKFKAVKKG